MRKIEEYKEHAEECRTLARRSKSQADRDMLMNMATTWESLAEGRTRSMEIKNRLATMEER